MGRDSLKNEYQQLLHRLGYKAPSLESWTRVSEKLMADAAIWTRDEGIVDPDLIDWKLEKEFPIPEPGTVPMNMIVGPLSVEIEKAATEWEATKWRMSLPLPVYCGVFPTGKFNAVAAAIGDGALLLVNEGLMYLLHQFFEIWGLHISIPGDGEEQDIEPVMSRDQAKDALAEVVHAYLAEGNSATAKQLPMIGGIRGAHLRDLALSSIKFVVAHEFGHAYGGHLTTTKGAATEMTSFGDLDLIPKSWAQEYEADLLALRLSSNEVPSLSGIRA